MIYLALPFYFTKYSNFYLFEKSYDKAKKRNIITGDHCANNTFIVFFSANTCAIKFCPFTKLRFEDRP